MTVLGTRPEIIRLSIILKKLDLYCDNVVVHTGQNYDRNLSSLFFEELHVREPNYYLNIQENSASAQIGRILVEVGKIIEIEKPDRFLILGDTNSGLTSIIAKRTGIPVFHMEAGNRCYDDRVPEEVNRKIIDHSSNIYLPYTQNSKQNLICEGISNNLIYVIGNPIYEVIEHYSNEIKQSTILDKLKIESSGYFLATAHRAENVDDKARLTNLLQGLENIGLEYGKPVICSLHPRTRNKMEQFGIPFEFPHLRFGEPFGFFDFITLEKNAKCVITDSGTVQEECCIFGIPNITIRDVTERPETIESGSNILSGVSPLMMTKAVNISLNETPGWKPPLEYNDTFVSSKVIKILLGHYS